MIRWAKITTSFEDFHAYPNAPNQVSFLRQKHRHMFHVVIWIEQFHDQRDIEYIAFKWWLDELLRSHRTQVALWPYTASCETMAHELGSRVRSYVGAGERVDRRYRVEVTEDGENGALVEL